MITCLFTWFVYCTKSTCFILSWWISWYFLLLCMWFARREKDLKDSDVKPSVARYTRCSWSVWLTANLCNATILLFTPAVPFSTIGLILIDVDSVLSHIPFTLMYPHLLQTSEISPERYIHYFGTGEQQEGLSPINWDVWPLASTRQISRQVDTMTVTVQKPSGATLSGQEHLPLTLPPVITKVENGDVSNFSFLSFKVVCHFHDYGRTGTFCFCRHVEVFVSEDVLWKKK